MHFRRKYLQIITQNFSSSNSASINCKSLTHLNFPLIAIGIENYLPTPSQFLYLLLITNTTPFLARKYKSKKYIRLGEARKDTVKMISYPNQPRLDYIFNKFMWEFMPSQLPPENSVIKIDKMYLKLIVWNTPLDVHTHCVQTSETSFIADIPLYAKFITKRLLRSEIAIWIFFYEFLRPNDYWSMKSLGVTSYSYGDN